MPEHYQENIINACWLHDTIEDTRNTYNDIKTISNETVANIVYAVTNEKGKTRKERANDKYYQGIILEPFARFVKLCDRLVNVKYSVDTNSRMKEVYRKENEHFIKSLFDKDTFNYEDMLSELHGLLAEIEIMEEPKNENQQIFAIHNVNNCPDLTDLWFQTNGKRQQGTISEDEAKKIYDALNTLEKHDLCQLKFGI